MIINAEGQILGRLASFIAKQALLGHTVNIINCERTVISGKKPMLFKRYKQRKDLGRNPYKGPFFPKMADQFVKRAVRGMLPYKEARGRAALKRIRCYVGVPDNLKEQVISPFSGAESSKLPKQKYLTVKDICQLLGGKE